ncbi:DegV family protein [Bacillus timonensis]|nr:DegV family protein [Bacillus timonensis]
MANIKIVTDSTVDLSNEQIEAYNLEVVPLSISIDGDTYLDRVDITPSEFIEKMALSKELPKSSQPAIGSFVEVYNRLTADGSDVISIHMSSDLSGTFRSAQSAAEMVDGNVSVVDSRFISKAMSFQVIEAAKMASEGNQVDDILFKLKEIQKNTRLFVIVDTLENLVKGGRIGKGKALLGSLLNIKPIAILEDGVYAPITKVRSHSQIVKYLTKRFLEDVSNKSLKDVGIVHADGEQLANKLRQSLLDVSDCHLIDVEETTPIISTHTGRGAIGFMYYFN